MGPGHAQRGRDGEFGWFCAECLPGIHHSSLSREMRCMARGLVRYAWQLREALLQCPEHWHYSAWLQEFLERSSRQTTGLSLHRAANDAWESL